MGSGMTTVSTATFFSTAPTERPGMQCSKAASEQWTTGAVAVKPAAPMAVQRAASQRAAPSMYWQAASPSAISTPMMTEVRSIARELNIGGETDLKAEKLRQFYSCPPPQDLVSMPYVPPHLRAQPGHEGRDTQAPSKSLADLASGPLKHTHKKPPPNRTPPGPGEYRRNRHSDSSGGKQRASAPKAFGTLSGRRCLAPSEDIEGGTRVDAEGMVYDLDGTAVYFCDRFRRYRFDSGAGGLSLLRALCSRLRTMLELNSAMFDPDEEAAKKQKEHGYELYEEKPTLRSNSKRVGADGESHTVGTWSNEEYGLVGFQWMYLRFKSYQRFSETWALLERCALAGLFNDFLSAAAASAKTGGDRLTLRFVSLGGGPGFELLAVEFFMRYWAEVGENGTDEEKAAWLCASSFEGDRAADAPYALELVSLDLQPSWATYVKSLGAQYDFAQWDVHGSGAAPILGERGVDPNVTTVCMLSNILCYCSDEQTAELFSGLLSVEGGVSAIVVNERGAEQPIVPRLQKRGVHVRKLLDQASAGRDDRQMIFLPATSAPAGEGSVSLEAPIFPNQPYEERKSMNKTTDGFENLRLKSEDDGWQVVGSK